MMDLEDMPERFRAKVTVDAETGCWIWNASLSSGGYGKYRVDGALRAAHRVAYEALVGTIPDGLVLDHYVCERKPCVNPGHVRLATSRENTLRGTSFAAANLAKTHCPRGHEYAGANLYVGPAGRRYCRTCQRERQRVAA